MISRAYSLTKKLVYGTTSGASNIMGRSLSSTKTYIWSSTHFGWNYLSGTIQNTQHYVGQKTGNITEFMLDKAIDGTDLVLGTAASVKEYFVG